MPRILEVWKWSKQKILQMTLEKKLRFFFHIIIVFMTVVMLIITTVVTVRSSLKNTSEQMSSQLFYMASSYVSWLERSKETAMAMQIDPSVQAFCRNDKAEGNHFLSIKSDASEALLNKVNENREMNFICLVNTRNNAYCYSGNYSIPYNGIVEFYEAGMEKAELGKKHGSFKVSFARGNPKDKRLEYSVSFYQPIYSTEVLNQQVGMLCMNLKNTMYSNINDMKGDLGAAFGIADTNGQILCSMDDGLKWDRRLHAFLSATETQEKTGQFISENTIYFYQKMKDWNYYIIGALPLLSVLNASIISVFLMVVVMLMVMFAVMGLSHLLARKNAEPMEKLLRAMDQIGMNQQVSLSVADMGADFAKVGEGFNSMMETIRQLMLQSQEEQREIDQIRLNSLQSQIQPHFLYNTLECIRWQARLNGDKEVSDMLMALASYYRICLSKGKDIITLEKELEHIGYYIKLQNMRYGDIILYKNYVREEFYHVMLPKLTLQPLIENSIYHGIRVKEGMKGRVEINAAYEDGDVVISVCDSGLDMTTERIDEMNKAVKENREDFGYGIRNVNRRIELLFGKTSGTLKRFSEKEYSEKKSGGKNLSGEACSDERRYGLFFSLNNDKGVCVKIRLPRVHEISQADNAADGNKCGENHGI